MIKSGLEELVKAVRAYDGEEPIEAREFSIVATPFDLVLLDLYMPRVNGLKVLRYKQDTPPLQIVPVIMLINSDSPSHIEDAITFGAGCYVQ